ncbi:CMT1A duplicated region transcript 1 protein [Chanos chanos]|uniref:CMT1A duplicated region transcript 1 protein n=1 Tax=Chanos chanos TaxID=29144 RepID=A0A6J2VCZ5_CHACN|nr:CMT1A duplicated region transcript 1 protein [Chanos chanos]
MKWKSDLSVASDLTFRCKTKNAEFNQCGDCQSCLLSTKLYDSTLWLKRADNASKRRFLIGLLLRCNNLQILKSMQNVLQFTLRKDFIYARCRSKPNIREDNICSSRARNNTDKAFDNNTQHGMEISETWDWFGGGPDWTKSYYLRGVLSICNTEILHMLGNLVRVLIEREKRKFLHLHCVSEGNEDDVFSIPESKCSFHTDEHPELDLLIQASSIYEPVSLPSEAQHGSQTVGPGEEHPSNSQLYSCQSQHASRAGSVMREEESKGRDTYSDSSEDPTLIVVPRSSWSLSGVSCHRDFIRMLPVHLAKKILGLLDRASLHSCQHVSQHWCYLTAEILRETEVKKMVENQTMALQGNPHCRVSPVYAKIREVLVPIREEERHIHLPENYFSKHRKERGFESVYMGVKTRPVQMEERNVYCGVYNVLVLQEREDPTRVTHYGGGQIVALGSKDRTVRLLDIVTLKEVPLIIQGHAGSIRAVLICEERGLVISASYDLSIRCWNLRTGTCTMLFRGHQGTINCLDLHGDQLVSGAKDCKVKVWNLLTGQCHEHLRFKHHNPVTCVKIDKALVLSSCEGGMIKMWGMETASLLKMITGHQGSVRCLFFDQWHILSGGSDGQVMAWSTNCDFRKSLMTYRHPKEVHTLSFIFLRVITGCLDGKIRIFNFLTGDCLRIIKASTHQSPVLSIHTHHNNIVVNTRGSVLIFQFAKVRWDYSASAEREFFDFRDLDSPKCMAWKLPHAVAQTELVRQAPVRPATFEGHCSARKYMDLQRKVFAKLPSSSSPARPADGLGHTPTSSGREQLVMTRSERAVRDKVRKRGPHHSLTPDHVFLKVSSSQHVWCSNQAGANMELNARVRDAWGPLGNKPSTDLQLRASPAPPKAQRRPQTQTHVLFTYSPYKGTAEMYSPLSSFATDQNTQTWSKRSSPDLGRPQTVLGFAEHRSRPQSDRKRPKSSSSVRPGMRKVGFFTTTAAENIRSPQPLDPFREHSAFQLRTDTQLEEYIRDLTKCHQQMSECGDNQEKRWETMWKMRLRGVPITEFTRKDQVYAPELGLDTYI